MDKDFAKEWDNRSADIIKNLLRNRYTIEFLGTWKVIHNSDFKVVEFDHFRISAGLLYMKLEWMKNFPDMWLLVECIKPVPKKKKLT